MGARDQVPLANGCGRGGGGGGIRANKLTED